MDFGKDVKFGGPFTEEVEDVKTVVRLVPLPVSVYGVALSIIHNGHVQLHAIPSIKQTLNCVADLKEFILSLTAVLLIPAYRFILYPVFYKYIPSMLKRIGIGLFLCFVGTLVNLSLDTVEYLHNNTSQCMLHSSTGQLLIPTPIYWVLIVNIIYGVEYTLVFCSVLELTMAQTPNRMRGIMIGLVFTIQGISMLAGFLLQLLFHQFNTVSPCCGFYYYLVLSLLSLLSLVMFIFLAKRYKMRERDRHVNIQAIAEEHYERYFDQEEEYMREVAIDGRHQY